MKHSLLSFSLIISLSSCAVIRDSPVTELERTWEFAVAMLPAKYLVTEGTRVAPGFYLYPQLDDWSRDIQEKYLKSNVDKVPVVLHLHGCSGIGGGDSRWAHAYAEMGYLTILPNSFRRPDRKSLCNAGNWGYRSRLRIEEAEYAMQQISKIPWVDVDRVFLSGFSEGGNSLSFYRGEKFQAYIILGTNCRHAGGSPKAPKNIPVLNIVGSTDHFGYGNGCFVNRSIGGSRRVIVEGAGHDVSKEEQALRAAQGFLEDCCNK